MKKNPFAPNEHDIMNLCISYLTMRGFVVMRLNSGKIPQTDRYGKKRLISLLPAGTPDILAFKPANILGLTALYFFEVKIPGGKPTYLQEAKMKELENHGAKCFTIHSLEELQACLAS